MEKIFVTGGTGYIGSHTVLLLLEAGYDVRVFDNLSNSTYESIKRVEKLTGKTVEFIEGDIRDYQKVKESLEGCSAVMHFAGLKAVGESVENPLKYYDNNVNGSITLFKAMKDIGVKRIIFSSSATVYGEPKYFPIDENHSLNPTNPYGRTKLMIEQVLRDIYNSDNEWRVGILRYFNPIGSHSSGEIGEDPNGIPNNLMPYITQVASKKLDKLRVFGCDYDTDDGTGVRDYIHVMDLASGHLKLLENLEKEKFAIYNLGTGEGYSVLDIINTFEKVNNLEIPYEMVGRREGDIAVSYADSSNANNILGWKAKKNLEDMCKDAWNWQVKNPKGYKS